jgi:hypothetical protein
MSTDEDRDIIRLMHKALEKSRDYASYWAWKLDKRQPELHAAQVLSRFLFPGKDYSVSSVVNDPPDVLVQIGGIRYGIEVTEIVDQNAVERAAKRKQLRLPIEYDWGDWNSDRLFLSLSNGILAKDRKLTDASQHYDKVLLAFVTDETMIYPQLVTSVLAMLRIETQYIDRAFVILSYDPVADASVFRDRCPIFEIALSR